jgi:TPR repeat protein
MKANFYAGGLSLLLACALPHAAHATTASEAQELYTQAREAMKTKDYALAEKNLLIAAEAGNADAQTALGQMYLLGNQGPPQDLAKALSWSQKGADQGNAMAVMNLGIMYRNGQGVVKDISKAMTFFETASAAGQMKASRYIGLIHADAGEFEKAVAAYQLAADRGDITSQYLLGKSYEMGSGITQDYALAAKWYTKSAERGDHVASDGMVGLGSLYERGLGVEKDAAKAVALYQQAAAVENEQAKKELQRLGMKVK